jgi:hypothetical protein
MTPWVCGSWKQVFKPLQQQVPSFQCAAAKMMKGTVSRDEYYLKVNNNKQVNMR